MASGLGHPTLGFYLYSRYVGPFFHVTYMRLDFCHSKDMLVFPKGLVQCQHNADVQEHATAILAFGSANAENVSVALSVFTTGIDDEIMVYSFKTDICWLLLDIFIVIILGKIVLYVSIV